MSRIRAAVDDEALPEKLEGLSRCGFRWALLTNDAARTAAGERVIDDLLRRGIRLTALLAPEHGLDGATQAGDDVPDGVDARTGLPVVSLYGKSPKIPEELFACFDGMLADLPDVGVRYFTYPDTLFRAMEQCAAHGRPVVVLDRPNPLGRAILEGPLAEASQRSDVAPFPVPVRHGMTLGEYARHAVGRHGLATGVELHVLPPEIPAGAAEPLFPEWGIPWRNPSPNLRSFEALCCYPGTCLFEGTNLSEGRGTETPFQLVGAPWLDPEKNLAAAQIGALTGLALAIEEFTPTASKYAGMKCRGIAFRVTNYRSCRAFAPAFRILDAIRRTHSTQFEFLIPHFDQLLGSDRYRRGLESAEELLARAEEPCAAFARNHE